MVPALTLLSHPDPRRVGERCLLPALLAGREVALSRTAPDFSPVGSVLGTPLRDPFVSRRPIRMVPDDYGAVRVIADPGGSALTLSEGPVHGDARLGPAALAAGVPFVLAERLALVLHLVDLDLDDTGDRLDLIGGSTGIAQVRRAIRRLADLTVPVLLRGETGTGKERVARALHDHGPRRGGPFVSVNLGAVPKELAAAELFGATRGAYTSATRDRDGFFATAAGGTLFLDEIGEAPPEVQALLLRVLETGEMFPVGSPRPVATDVRLIAATDADLEEHIRAGRFKAPLLHRLAGYEIRLPALREHREDIGLLFHHFAREEFAAMGEPDRFVPGDPCGEPWLSAALALRLACFAWPGNVRQLRNVARQLAIYSRGHAQIQIDPRLAAELAAGAAPSAEVDRIANGSVVNVAALAPRPEARTRRRHTDVTEAELLAALRKTRWDLKAAGDLLNVPRPSMYDLIDKCPGIRTVKDLTTDEITRCFTACGGDLDRMVEALQVSRRGLRRRVSELGLK
ncbi:MAG TPA: sigma 54-interacting transcriptional regulator [Kofleriaceae bacterium]|nr:sigma 54-interacting transcriptional regulator [Kofleriaceae bacterium]